MPRRLVALSATAVAAVYFAGLQTTQSPGVVQAVARGATNPTTRPVPTPVSTRAPLVSRAALPPAATAQAPVQASVPVEPVSYRDGTYTGSGTSRRGGVDVSVTVQEGRIVSAAITGGSTQYPLSRIAALPGRVLAHQSAEVDRITGATYSVQAYRQAVQQALAQASSGQPSA